MSTGSKSNRRVAVGDLLAIPLAQRAYALCRVLFVSKRYRHVILLGSSHLKLSSLVLPDQLPKCFDVQRIYTSRVCISSGRWHILGSTIPTGEEHQASLRIVAGSVWLQDEELRSATKEDNELLQPMDVAGCGLVEQKLLKQFEDL